MSPRNGFLLALAFILLGSARTARAQSESVSLDASNPERFLFQNGSYRDVTKDPRPQNLNPTGVNFGDCEQDLRLDFTVTVSGFEASDAHLEVWAGVIDCTQDANRNTVNTGEAHPCWQVASNTKPMVGTAQTLTVSVYTRDVLRYEQPPNGGAAQPYDPGFHDGAEGESACHVQTSDAAVPLNVTFIPVTSAENAIGISVLYPLDTDLVAPIPPSGVSVTGGSGVLDASWASVSSDPDRVGFALWAAPSQSGGCGSSELQDGGWSLPSGEGISVLPTQYLAGEVEDWTATRLTSTNLMGGTRYAAVVTSMDASGNYGPPSASACAEPTAPSSAPATVKAGCACAAGDDRSAWWPSFLAGIALVATLARRRASRGCSIGPWAGGSPS